MLLASWARARPSDSRLHRRHGEITRQGDDGRRGVHRRPLRMVIDLESGGCGDGLVVKV